MGEPAAAAPAQQPAAPEDAPQQAALGAIEMLDAPVVEEEEEDPGAPGSPHAPPQPGLALPAAAAEHDGNRTFPELLAWAWSAYERLGTVGAGHPVDGQHETPLAGKVPETYLAADVCDLGRLLLRMLLQPHKSEMLLHPLNPDTPPDPSTFSPSLQSLLLRLVHVVPSRRLSARQALASEWAREPLPGQLRPLCCCWKLADAIGTAAT